MLNISYGMLAEFIDSKDTKLQTILIKSRKFSPEDIPMLEQVREEVASATVDNQSIYENTLRYDFDRLIRKIEQRENSLAYSNRRNSELTDERKIEIEAYKKVLRTAIEMKVNTDKKYEEFIGEKIRMLRAKA